MTCSIVRSKKEASKGWKSIQLDAAVIAPANNTLITVSLTHQVTRGSQAWGLRMQLPQLPNLEKCPELGPKVEKRHSGRDPRPLVSSNLPPNANSSDINQGLKLRMAQRKPHRSRNSRWLLNSRTQKLCTTLTQMGRQSMFSIPANKNLIQLRKKGIFLRNTMTVRKLRL